MRSLAGCLRTAVVTEWSGPPAVHSPLAVSSVLPAISAPSSAWKVAAFVQAGTGGGSTEQSLLLARRPPSPATTSAPAEGAVGSGDQVDAPIWRYDMMTCTPPARAGDAVSCLAVCGALIDEGHSVGVISAIGTLGGGGPGSLMIDYMRCEDQGRGPTPACRKIIMHSTFDGSFWSLADLSSQGGGGSPADNDSDRLLAVGMTGKASILSIRTCEGLGGWGPHPRYALPGMRPAIGELHLPSDPLVMASAGTRWGCAGTDAAVLLGLRNGSVLLWDARVASTSGTATYAGRPAADPAGTSTVFRCGASVAGLHPLPGSPYAIVADARDTAAIVDARMLQRRVRSFAGYTNSARRHGTARSPCGRFFACTGTGTGSGAETTADAAAAADGSSRAEGTFSRGVVRLWEVGTGRLCRELLLPERLGAGLQCAFMAGPAAETQCRRGEAFRHGPSAWTAASASASASASESDIAPADIGLADADGGCEWGAPEAYGLQLVVSCANGVCVAR